MTCTSGNRNLLDFSSVAVNPVTGCGIAAIPGDPFDTPPNENTKSAAAYTSNQDGGRCLTAANAGRSGNVTGGGGRRPLPPCADTRRFTFRLHHARRARVVKVDVFVNGKRRVHLKGRNLTKVTLTRLPKKTFVVKVVATQSTGSKLISVRTYRGCTKSRSRTRRHRHR